MHSVQLWYIFGFSQSLLCLGLDKYLYVISKKYNIHYIFLLRKKLLYYIYNITSMSIYSIIVCGLKNLEFILYSISMYGIAFVLK